MPVADTAGSCASIWPMNEQQVVDAPSAIDSLVTEIERAIVGKRDVINLVLDAVLAGGHVLLDDVPGVAKTLLARSFATVSGLSFSRIQFTPDLMPGDIMGSSIWNRSTNEMVFQPGPINANVVLADEINRAPAKTQAALLEAMAEGQVTVDGVTRLLPTPFVVIATQNPVEYEGTYELPEAQLDRFMIRTSIGYPSATDEAELVNRRIGRSSVQPELDVTSSPEEIAALGSKINEIRVHPAVVDYVVRMVGATREFPGVELGASPRGSLAMVAMARAAAMRQGRSAVLPDDVKRIATATLSHRLVLSPELWVQGAKAAEIVAEIVNDTVAPAPDDLLD